MPDAPSIENVLSISPAIADLSPKGVCHFTVNPVRTDIKWAIKPAIGSIDESGIYMSPERIAAPQRVIVTATATTTGQVAIASIDLTDTSAKIFWLGWYAIGVAIVLAIAIPMAWSYLHWAQVRCRMVVVNPPSITLDPTRDEKVSFTATLIGDPKGSVKWSVDGGEIDSGGIFKLKSNPKPDVDTVIKVTATYIGDPDRTGTGIVHLISGEHFEVLPQAPSAFANQQFSFRVPGENPMWSVSRSDLGSISRDGTFTASGAKSGVVQVTAWGGKSHKQASAAVLVSSDVTDDFPGTLLLIFVIMCGALGSMLYYASSFVSYVGNQTFRSSWFWFYISRPFVGGALAVIFFFVIGSEMLGGTTNKLMNIALVSALVGLFSDKAVKKLSDVLDVLLATKDDRKDKVDKPQSGTAVTPPKILSASPPAIPPNTDTSVEIKGANFKAGFTVKVNGQTTAPIHAMEQSFTIIIPAALAQSPKVTITVTTDQGTATFELPVN